MDNLPYEMTFMEFRKSNSTIEVEDYRPCNERFSIPNIDNGRVIWLKSGTILYVKD